MSKITVIDAGSNAIRLAIAQQKGSRFELIYKHREAIRLGGDVFDFGKISPPLLKETVSVFKKFKRISMNFGCFKIRAIGTSALREAKNQQIVIEKIFEETGINLEVISGSEESQLVFKAICAGMNLTKSRALLIDIGGGSVELVGVNRGKVTKGKSFPIGTVRLLHKLNRKDQYRQIKSIENSLQPAIKFIRDLKMPFDFCVGIGGNIERMAKVNSLIKRASLTKTISLDDILRMYDLITPFSLGKRMKLFDLKADQVDVLVPAMILCTYFMQTTNTDLLRIPGVGIKDGLILQELKL